MREIFVVDGSTINSRRDYNGAAVSCKEICGELSIYKRNFIKGFKKAYHRGVFDGKELQNLLFPKVTSDIFVSYSGQDIHKAYSLKKSIETLLGDRCLKKQLKYGILAVDPCKVFVDFLYWANAREIQENLIDDPNFSSYFQDEDQNACNVTEHLHLMLSVALAHMIQTCKSFVFIQTEASVKKGLYTQSPWIYYELEIVRLCMKKTSVSISAESRKTLSESAKILVNYSVKDFLENICKNEGPTPPTITLDELVQELNKKYHPT
ncbi:hypothetical protein NHP21005_09730 [Helicobacter sp. NHP21005]|uniref:hypothetical protein n=1 Tax=Helicobacter felistomachi TaxID=3040201 RepID=UPI0025740E5C|nr:hypothetical protein [Helicobacter sp. NHP21005]BEG57285.1 hypothetical protein NHP21005_09730 [Helicobacter sp. NHP21005]